MAALKYEAFTIHVEARTLERLEQLLWANTGKPVTGDVVQTELQALACTIRAMLQKLPDGLEMPKDDDTSWLA